MLGVDCRGGLMREAIATFLHALETERGASRNTTAAYRNDLGQFAAFTGSAANRAGAPEASLGLFREDVIAEYLASLRTRGYAASTIARKTAAIKSFSAFLVERGILVTDPAASATRPRIEYARPRAMSEVDVEVLLATPREAHESRPNQLRDIAMLETLYATGVRVSELVALDDRDVRLDQRSVRCGSGTGKERSLHLSDRAVDALTTYLANGRPLMTLPNERALFVNQRGGRLTRQGFWLILRSYADQIGIDGVTPHTLRHSFALHAIHRGVALRDVQQSLGHVNLASTQVYQERDQRLSEDESPYAEQSAGAIPVSRGKAAY